MSGSTIPFGMPLSSQMLQYAQGSPMGFRQMPVTQMQGAPPMPNAAPLQGLVIPQPHAGAAMEPSPPPSPQPGAQPQQQGGMISQLFQNPQAAMQMAQAMRANAASQPGPFNAIRALGISNQVGPAAGAMSTGALIDHQGGNTGNLGLASGLQGTMVGNWLSMFGRGFGGG